jgi:hypothetical protein
MLSLTNYGNAPGLTSSGYNIQLFELALVSWSSIYICFPMGLNLYVAGNLKCAALDFMCTVGRGVLPVLALE